MDTKKHDEIMSFIMNKLEEEKLNLSDGISIWHSMGVFMFSQLEPENKDIKKTYENIKEYLEQVSTKV
jgi:CRISPR/Cas system endoribonuclease Cas6 (RAMP superfamily)